MLKRQNFIETCYNGCITAGEPLDHSISAKLERADIIRLLASLDFLASDYCSDREMACALERHRSESCTVIPVILRPCDWRDAPFGGLMATPKDGRPITQWPDIDAAFLDVTTAIKAALRNRGVAGPEGGSSSPPVSPRTEGARSSNLRVTKRFTDRDRDPFLHEAFEFMAKFLRILLLNSKSETEAWRDDFGALMPIGYPLGRWPLLHWRCARPLQGRAHQHARPRTGLLLACKGMRNTASDAAAGARNERELSFEFFTANRSAACRLPHKLKRRHQSPTAMSSSTRIRADCLGPLFL